MEAKLLADQETAPQKPSVLRGVASYIIATEFCERLCYYGFAGSLVLFFQSQLNMTNADSVNMFSLWNGFVYITPLVGGYIADSYWGRYKTILVFAIIYLFALVLFIAGIYPAHIVTGLIYFGMYLVAFGAGGIKPNCSTMGADQFDNHHPQDVKESKLFFSYFYWSINLGALVSYTLVAYICQYGIAGLGGKDYGFFVGYLIPAVVLFFGILIFMSGSARYRKQPPEGSMIPTIVAIFYQAYKRCKEVNVTHWLDSASKSFGGSYGINEVESSKYIYKLMPFLSVMIPYWGIYGQTKTAFQLQGCQMSSNLGSMQLPVSTMNIFNNVAILILVPVFENYFYPFLRKKGFKLSMLTKIGLGFGLALTTMLLAAVLEYVRLHYAPAAGDYYDVSARDNISPCRNIDNYNPYQFQSWASGGDVSEPLYCSQTCDNRTDGVLDLDCISCDDIPQKSDISILWQVPLFVLIGISEIFASITSLEFFYSQAPTTVRSVSQAANLFTNALGSWLTIPLVLLVNSNPNNQWVPSNIDEGHLTYYYFVLASLMGVALVVFIRLSKGFQYADPLVLEQLSKPDSSAVDHDAAESGQSTINSGLLSANRTHEDEEYVILAETE